MRVGPQRVPQEHQRGHQDGVQGVQVAGARQRARRANQRHGQQVHFDNVDRQLIYRQQRNEPEPDLPRLLRSRGPAPVIPNVLPADPMRSRQLNRDLTEIHLEHDRTRRQVDQPQENAQNQN